MQPHPETDTSAPPATGRATRFRATEYLIPVLLVLLAAWTGWWIIQQSRTRARQRTPETPLRLPGNTPESQLDPRLGR